MSPRNLNQTLADWLGASFRQIGQVIHPEEIGYELRHCEDAERDDLELFTRPGDARLLAVNDDAGRFRPLKTAPNLRHGWRLHVEDAAALRCALDYFYPAMLGALRDFQRGALPAVPLRDTLARQSGMYAITRKITDAQAQELIGGLCTSRGGCLKTILWPIAPGLPITSLPREKFDAEVSQIATGARPLPMLCHEACNLLVAKAREVVKGKRTNEE